MDTTLLQQRRGPSDPVTVAPGTNGPEPTDLIQYQEIEVEPAQPPFRLRLDPPVDYDGTPYTELVFDFDAVIGKDFQRAERTFHKTYKSEKNEVVMMEMTHHWIFVFAAQVADVPMGLIMKLPRRAYAPLRLKVLKACGGSPEEEKE